jgi:phage FluMu protein Com
MSRRLQSVPNTVADDLAAQDASLDVTCPRCNATKDTYCRNTTTGDTLRASHWQRIRTAQETP